MKVTNARELGYMIAYSRCQNKRTFFERHTEALEQCRKISRLPHSLSVKGNLLRAPLSRMLYGTELHMVSLEHLRQLRTAMARAILGPQAQPNPYLAVSVLHRDVLDPHFQLLYHVMRSLRRFLWSLSPSERDKFFRRVVRHDGQPWRVFGPAGALRYHLDFLGWTMTKHGEIRTDAFGKLSFLGCSPDLLRQELILSWERHLQLQLQSRQDWHGAPQIDIPTTASLFVRLPADRQRILAGEITGSFQLQHRKTKWISDLDDQCPLCGEEDTILHRRLFCPALQSARIPHEAIVQQLQELDPILATLPVVFRHPEHCFDFWWNNRVPPAAMTDDARRTLEHDYGRDLRPLVFTDGSAAPPDCPEARQAASAAVLLSRQHVETSALIASLLLDFDTTQRIPAEFVTMFVTPTNGSQTIPRSELAIVVRVLQSCPRVEVVTDSQYVIDQHAMLLQQDQIGSCQAMPNYDLLQQLHALQRQPGYDVVLTKVKSHQLQSGPPTWSRLLQLGNEAADQAAKEARKSPVATCRQVPLQHHQEERQRVQAQFALCYDVGCLRKQLLAKVSPEARDPDPSQATPVLQYDDTHAFPPGLHLSPLLRYSLWGEGFSAGILYWATHLKWPSGSFLTDKADVASPRVTWMELLLDCQLPLQLYWPHSIVSSKYPPVLRYPAHHGVHQVDIPFSWTLSNFRRAMRHLEDLLQISLLPRSRGTVNSLYRVGARGHKKGIPWRPQLCCPQEVEQTLKAYFTEHPRCTQFRHQPQLLERTPHFVVNWTPAEVSYDPQIGKKRLQRLVAWKQNGKHCPLRFASPK